MRAPITQVLGARPNFMKAAPVIRALAALGHDQRVVHTGQHYDERMSEVFFVQLGLPRPDVNLGIGSGSHASQTAEVLTGMEREFTENSPALAMVYGEVNSTLGAALAAAKLGVPLAHVEAGLRSFDDSMPAGRDYPGTYLLDLACARECAQADVAEHAGVSYAFTAALDPELARREYFAAGDPGHGLRLFSVS